MNIHRAKAGSRVKGFYHNQAYTGTITSIRPYTVNYRATVVFVQFDQPITMWNNQPTNDGCFYVNSEGVDAWGGDSKVEFINDHYEQASHQHQPWVNVWGVYQIVLDLPNPNATAHENAAMLTAMQHVMNVTLNEMGLK